VSVDTERRELVLHLLDSRQAEATMADIRRDFLAPLQAWQEVRL